MVQTMTAVLCGVPGLELNDRATASRDKPHIPPTSVLGLEFGHFARQFQQDNKG